MDDAHSDRPDPPDPLDYRRPGRPGRAYPLPIAFYDNRGILLGWGVVSLVSAAAVYAASRETWALVFLILAAGCLPIVLWEFIRDRSPYIRLTEDAIHVRGYPGPIRWRAVERLRVRIDRVELLMRSGPIVPISVWSMKPADVATLHAVLRYQIGA